MTNIPRPEHPRPDWERAAWLNLNGEWEFEKDPGVSGVARRLWEKPAFDGKITVPFCPESRLSGIGDVDFMPAVWYRRRFTLPASFAGCRVLLHIGACDWETRVFVNGKEVGAPHHGGYTSFSYDITDALTSGTQTLAIFARDDTRDQKQASGKQSEQYGSYGCLYTRTTGIWQTVWLEAVPETHVVSARYATEPKTGTLTVTAALCGKGTLRAETSFGGKPTGCAEVQADGGTVTLTVPLSETHLWEVGKGNLYDLTLTFGDDCVKSYFGVRSVKIRNGKFYLNDHPVFQRLVLDQGFYPDGIYTAPTEDELVGDIRRSMACGFNGARLHEKVFEARFLYHADKLGYLVWGEYPNWGFDTGSAENAPYYVTEWVEAVSRDINHPAVIGWCPFNETWNFGGHFQKDEVLASVYHLTKALDPSRPCIDTSGNYHVVTDIFDLHDYDQDPAVFRATYADAATPAAANDAYNKRRPDMGERQTYRGEPLFISEYGGIGWRGKDEPGWGYGNDPKTEEEFRARYKGLTDALLDSPYLLGFCYTQLTDVEQERNGVYTYDRKPKFDTEFFRAVNSRRAKIEEE